MPSDIGNTDGEVRSPRAKRFSVWFTLIEATVIYLLAFVLELLSGPRPGLDAPMVVRLLLGATGMFVPFGVWNAVYAVSAYLNPFKAFQLAIFAIPACIALLLLADRRAPRSTSALVNVGYNLLVLFFATAMVDFLLYGHWLSWYVLWTGDAFGGVH